MSIVKKVLLMCVMAFQNHYSICVSIKHAKKPKIAIISLYDRGYKHIGQYSDRNKKEYAALHGYDLFIYHRTLDATRPTAWSKILAIQRHINEYEWIFWSDADSLIMNKAIKLESIIDEQYDLLITQEAAAKNLNTGSFLIKNSAWSKMLLQNIYAQVQFIHKHGYWEQSALAYLLETNPALSNRIKILPQRVMNSHISEKGGEYQSGDFVIHFYGPIAKDVLIRQWYHKSING